MIDDWSAFATSLGIGVGAAVAFGLVVHLVLRVASRRREWARSLVAAARRPFWTILLLGGLWFGAAPTLRPESWWPTASHAVTIATIAIVAWFLIALGNYFADLTLGRNRANVPHSIAARRLRTQTLITHRLVTALIVVIAIGAALLTFDAVRALGASILASAGIISVIAGLAAQSVLSNMFAGVQLVFSNALRVDDVIVAEGEWGRVEEITLSYVVLHLWDDRRLVLPSTYFTTTPYQNWTRQGTELLGSIEFDLDWRVSPHRMREHLKTVLAETSSFDGRTSVLQVTDATGGSVRVRILVTAQDAPTLWDLRCYVREAMVLWVQNQMPDAAPAQRIIMADASADAPEAAEKPKPKAKPARKQAAEPEHASDEGLFTGSLQAVERASMFLRGEPRDDDGGDDGVADTLDLDAPIRD